MTVTVHSVKVKELPDFDDDFAQLASEFDTIGELRADTRRRLEAMRQQQQAIQARDRALETLLDQVDVPLPDSIVEEEAHRLEHSMHDQIERAGADWGTYLQMVGKSQEEFSAELHDQARRSVKTGLVLDQVAKQEDLGVNDGELSYFVTQQAEQMGVDPQVLARQIAEGGQIGAAAAEVLRGKAMALLASRVQIKDEAGHELDYNRLLGIDDEGGEAGSANADSEAETAAEEAKGAAEAEEAKGAAEAEEAKGAAEAEEAKGAAEAEEAKGAAEAEEAKGAGAQADAADAALAGRDAEADAEADEDAGENAGGDQDAQA